MATALAETPEFMTWTWDDIEPRYRELEGRTLVLETIGDFLEEWSRLADQIGELASRLKVATDVDTADEDAAARYRTFVQDTSPKVDEAEHRLAQKLLATGIVPEGMEVPMRHMQVDVELFREENLPLQSEEKLLAEEYFKISGAQTVEWEGEEIPVAQLTPILEEQDRARREHAWRLGAERRLEDRDAITDVWQKLLRVRQQIAANAGFPDYRSYRWRELKRFDYSPADAKQFHKSVERLVVPAVRHMYERRRDHLGIPSVRPWDRAVDVYGRPPLRPYTNAAELENTTLAIFERVDPALSSYFDTMRQVGLLDLENRKNKAPGAYCTTFPAGRRPFILANATGINDDVFTLLHESGHAFHVFEMADLPYAQQRTLGGIPIEFAEVASMGMELLAAPYLSADEGGFYSRQDAARARLDHLETILTLLPWIAAIDAFQHWVYENPADAEDPDKADTQWADLIGRFLPFVDWSGVERELRNDWRRIPHLFGWPFYFLEYGLAQLGALQVWVNARRDQSEAVQMYLHALSLGATRTLPELFEAAGARFAFDEGTIRDAVELLEASIGELEREQDEA